MFAVWAAVVTALYAHSVAPLGFIPGPAALRLLHATHVVGLHRHGPTLAPVEVTRGLSLMTTAGDRTGRGRRRDAGERVPTTGCRRTPAAGDLHRVGRDAFDGCRLACRLSSQLRATSRCCLPKAAIASAAGDARFGPFAAGSLRRRLAAAARSRPGASRLGRRGMTSQLTQVGRRVGFAAISIAVVVPGDHPRPALRLVRHPPHQRRRRFFATRTAATSISPIVSIRQELNEPDADVVVHATRRPARRPTCGC